MRLGKDLRRSFDGGGAALAGLSVLLMGGAVGSAALAGVSLSALSSATTLLAVSAAGYAFVQARRMRARADKVSAEIDAISRRLIGLEGRLPRGPLPADESRQDDLRMTVAEVSAEIGLLGGLVKDLAVTVAGHDRAVAALKAEGTRAAETAPAALPQPALQAPAPVAPQIPAPAPAWLPPVMTFASAQPTPPPAFPAVAAWAAAPPSPPQPAAPPPAPAFAPAFDARSFAPAAPPVPPPVPRAADVLAPPAQSAAAPLSAFPPAMSEALAAVLAFPGVAPSRPAAPAAPVPPAPAAPILDLPTTAPAPLSAERRPPAADRAETARRAAIIEALKNDRVEVHLQPVVSLPQRKVRFYEALARLRLADDALLVPAEFLPVLERAGLAADLDGKVVARSALISRHLAGRGSEAFVTCNLAPASLATPGFLRALGRVIDAYPDVPGRLVLEISQRCWRTLEVETAGALSLLRARGVSFALDRATDLRLDPLSLADRGVRYVKIPAEMLLEPQPADGLDFAAGDLAAVLARAGVKLVAERVEREECVPDLIDLNVPLGQGFVFAPPRAVRPDVLGAATPKPAEPAPAAPAAESAGLRLASTDAAEAEPRLPFRAFLRRAG